MKSFLGKSESEKGKELMVRYTNSVNSLKEGVKLPQIDVLSYNEDVLKISALIDSPTVLSFWSHTYYKHFKEIIYPNYLDELFGMLHFYQMLRLVLLF